MTRFITSRWCELKDRSEIYKRSLPLFRLTKGNIKSRLSITSFQQAFICASKRTKRMFEKRYQGKVMCECNNRRLRGMIIARDRRRCKFAQIPNTYSIPDAEYNIILRKKGAKSAYTTPTTPSGCQPPKSMRRTCLESQRIKPRRATEQ